MPTLASIRIMMLFCTMALLAEQAEFQDVIKSADQLVKQ